MQVKKYAYANLENRKGLYFAIGLLFVLSSIFCLFEFKFYTQQELHIEKLHLDLIEAEVIPISHHNIAPPPPPPAATTQFEIVSDHEEIVIELELEDMEIDDDAKVEVIIPFVEDVVEEEVIEEEIFTIVEQMPEYPGGMKALFQYLGESIEYPAMAKDAHIQGKVFITFVVSRNGEITEVEVLRGIGGGCDEEAIRVVKNMPKWNPGKQRGRAVKVQYNLPINFILK